MVPEILLIVVILTLVFWVLIPAFIDALQYLFVAVVYMTVVVVAFGITACVLLTLYFELDEPTIEDLTSDTEQYLDTTSYWIWTLD